MYFELHKITVDLVDQQQLLNLAREMWFNMINFVKSRLAYTSLCNFCKDVDLVSQESLILDTRYTNWPSNLCVSISSFLLQLLKVKERKYPLQDMVHFQNTKEVNRFTTLLNNLRLMCAGRWLEVIGFISRTQRTLALRRRGCPNRGRSTVR